VPACQVGGGVQARLRLLYKLAGVYVVAFLLYSPMYLNFAVGTVYDDVGLSQTAVSVWVTTTGVRGCGRLSWAHVNVIT
jgi:hypothetical protein